MRQRFFPSTGGGDIGGGVVFGVFFSGVVGGQVSWRSESWLHSCFSFSGSGSGWLGDPSFFSPSETTSCESPNFNLPNKGVRPVCRDFAGLAVEDTMAAARSTG